jgi:hypothetical protein
MSTHTTPTPLTADTGRYTRALYWLTGGIATIAVIVLVAIAVWPASEADKARADGEQLGQAVSDLYYADSSSEVDLALEDVHTAVIDTRDHAGDAVANQVADQEDALARAVDGFVGANTTDSSFESEVYQAELDTALNDMSSQADNFRDNAPEVQQAFWEGFDTGLNY